MRVRHSNCPFFILMLGVACLVLTSNVEAQRLRANRQASDAISSQGDVVPQLPNRPALVQPQNTVSPSVKQEELDDIMELRKSLGGGVMSVLGDMADGEVKQQLQADFESELGRLMQERSPVLPPKKAGTGPQRGALPLRVAEQPAKTGIHARVAALRRVSRNLEELAWDLEEINSYAEADQLRQQAQELRRKSRTMLEQR